MNQISVSLSLLSGEDALKKKRVTMQIHINKSRLAAQILIHQLFTSFSRK
jgi:hypothetical protein